MFTQEQAVKEWQELLLTKCEVKFNCGGDSMGDTDFSFFSNGKLVTEVSQDLQDYIENKMYDNVTFYQNSDGHYQGESGTVGVELATDDEEPYFVFQKYAQAEYNESYRLVADVKLTAEQVEFVNKSISAIFGNNDEQTQIVWKVDVILTDDDEKMLEDLIQEVENVAEGEIPEVDCDNYEINDWFAFSTSNEDDEDSELTIVGDILKLNVRRSVTTYEDSNW